MYVIHIRSSQASIAYNCPGYVYADIATAKGDLEVFMFDQLEHYGHSTPMGVIEQCWLDRTVWPEDAQDVASICEFWCSPNNMIHAWIQDVDIVS